MMQFDKIYPYLFGFGVADYKLTQKAKELISIPLNVATKTKHINAPFSPTSLYQQQIKIGLNHVH